MVIVNYLNITRSASSTCILASVVDFLCFITSNQDENRLLNCRMARLSKVEVTLLDKQETDATD